MSGVSFPVTRPSGRALLVGNPASRGQPFALLGLLGFECEEVDDPYTALFEICQQPQVFHAVVLSLASLYREELQVVGAIKARFPQIEVWLAQTDGRHAAMAEAIRLGADGLLSEDGLHRIGIPPASGPNHAGPNRAGPNHTGPNHTGPNPIGPTHTAGTTVILPHESNDEPDPPSQRPDSDGSPTAQVSSNGDGEDHESSVAAVSEPVLSADELRALLQEQPFSPPRADG